MNEREKIIQLARECGLNTLVIELFVNNFYHAAQREALEQAAKTCDGLAENGVCHTNYPEEAFAADCSKAIRQLIKELA